VSAVPVDVYQANGYEFRGGLIMEYFKEWLLQATNNQLTNEFKELSHDIWIKRIVESADKLELLEEEILKRMKSGGK
jgi:hypothetical protein